MKLLARAVSIFDYVIGFGAFLAGALLIWIMLSVNAEVVMRYFLNSPIIWEIEINEICLLFITFLAATWVLKIEGHVKMDIIISRLKPRTQAITNTVTSILAALGYSLVVWYGVAVTWDHFQRGIWDQKSILEIPNAAILWIIPVGGFLLCLQLLRRANRYRREWRIPPETSQWIE